ncbi:hypothetical protein AAFF_G00000350 [Aldrovandia affinis]|uniref:Uncharacterized protein n=1 Tax=Aldrovandia affinis TaxID=143900 RepID=A0AAD7TE38_9TELE|nr:hypothetical protein AAFF_G00000350 [Aldrovandia affinis]
MRFLPPIPGGTEANDGIKKGPLQIGANRQSKQAVVSEEQTARHYRARRLPLNGVVIRESSSRQGPWLRQDILLCLARRQPGASPSDRKDAATRKDQRAPQACFLRDGSLDDNPAIKVSEASKQQTPWSRLT